jgi:hypothetical protein
MAIPSGPIIRPFADSYLFDYSNEHVFYEVDHFFWLAELWGSPSFGLTAPSVADMARLKNVLIEGSVVHLRNIIEFLYPVRPQSTDVVAADFFPPGDWNKIRPAISSSLEDARIRANKEIAHLTTDRMAGTPPAKNWDFVGLADEIRPLLQLMSSQAQSTRLGPNVAGAIR